MGSFSQLSSGELPNPNDSEDWRSFWLKWDSEQLVGAIKERLQNEPDKEKDVPFFKSLLQGSRLVHLEEPYHLATTELFHTLLLQETEHRTQETYFREISDILLTELRYMIPRTLLALARDFLEQLQRFVPLNTAALEVVPPLIQTLAGLDILSTGDDSEWADCVTGTDAKDHMLDRICKLSWYPGLTLPLVSAFKDITFTTAQSDFFLSKVFKVLRAVDPDEIPPLVYQILLLIKGNRRRGIQELVAFFDELENQSLGTQPPPDIPCNFGDATPRPIQTLSSEKLCRTESIVLLHISFAVKQDQELGQEVLKLTKITETPRLGPFLLSVLLAIAKIHRFETAVLDLVKGKICTFYRNSQKSQLVLSGRGNGRTPVADNTLTDTFHRLACNANVGWDQTIPSLIQLALVLLDVASGGSQGTSSFFAKPKERPIRSTIIQAVIDSQQRLVDKETSSDNVGQDPIGQLGISTLQLIFQHHRMVRTDVLDQVIARIEFRAESSPSCIELLGRLVAEFPETLATEYLTKIKELFNGLVYLPPDVAEQVMLVVLPLTHYDQGFCDHLMLVLRKHMFSRDLEGRQVALVGLLVFLTTLT
ncbi:FANCI solenoid 2-domain-containing protein, partial [Dimargaris cristalligena]